MTFSADLKGHIQTGSISALVNDRIYPARIKDLESMPCIVYTFVFGEPQNSLDGHSSLLTRYIVQIDCWGKTRQSAEALAYLVRDRMNVAASSFRGVVTEFPLIDEYEPETDRYRFSLSCSCWHQE
jgi:hypothetical protein